MRSLVEAKTTLVRLLLFFLFLALTVAFEVAPNSPCSAICNRAKADWSSPRASKTNTSDVMCSDSSFGGSNSTMEGRQWRGCMACLQNSNYVSKVNGEADLFWFIFNMRFSFDWCVLGFTTVVNPVVDTSQVCSGVCSKLTNSFTDQLTSSNMTRIYTYCDASYGVTQKDYDDCGKCLKNVPYTNSLANYANALGTACAQQPSLGTVLSLNSSVVVGADNSTAYTALAEDSSADVSSVYMSINSNTASSSSDTAMTTVQSLSISAIIAITFITSSIFLALLTIIVLLIMRQRRKRLYLQQLHSQKVANNSRRFSAPDGLIDMFPDKDSQSLKVSKSSKTKFLTIEIKPVDDDEGDLIVPAQLSSRNYNDELLPSYGAVDAADSKTDRPHSIYEMAV